MKLTKSEILYKYRAINENTLKILKNGEIYFPSVDQFNDPYDGGCYFNYIEKDFTPENVFKYMLKLAELEYPDWSDEQIHAFVFKEQKDQRHLDPQFHENNKKKLRESMKNKLGVYCLTPKRNNYLMWSHYANSHSGICIGFCENVLSKHIGGILSKVEYSNELPIYSIKNFDIDTIEGVDNFHSRIINTKSNIWEYENEYRLVKINAARKIFMLPLNCIREIIFGCKTDQNKKFEIIEFVKEKNPDCEIFEANLNDKSFKLDITKIY